MNIDHQLEFEVEHRPPLEFGKNLKTRNFYLDPVKYLVNILTKNMVIKSTDVGRHNFKCMPLFEDLHVRLKKLSNIELIKAKL